MRFLFLILAYILAAMSLALATPDAWAINKCVDKAGKVTYQQDKCSEDAKQEVLKTPPSRPSTNASSKSPAPSGPAADDDREDAAILELVSVQTGYEACVGASPDLAQRHGAVYAEWRAGNKAALARLERSERYQLVLENGRKQLREPEWHMPGVREKLVKFCEFQFFPVLKKKIPN